MSKQHICVVLFICLYSSALGSLFLYDENSFLESPGDRLPACPQRPSPVPQHLLNSTNLPPALQKAFKKASLQIKSRILDNSKRSIGTDPYLTVATIYDDEIIWSEGFGNPAASLDTIYRVGSITKVITSLLLLQFRDKELISIDEPVSDYIKELNIISPHSGNPITWKSLMTQSSGLAGGLPCDFFSIDSKIFNSACLINNSEAWDRINKSESPPIFEMYSSVHYSDVAYAIIGRGLEQIFNFKYEDQVISDILVPLGMNSSFFDLTIWENLWSQIPPGFAGDDYLQWFVSQVDLNWARPTGQLYSTVRDLTQFVKFFIRNWDDVNSEDFTDKFSIFKSTIKEMMLPFFLNVDQVSGYGYPFEIYHSSVVCPDTKYWIRTKRGSVPGYTTYVAMIPEIRFGVAASMNNLYAAESVNILLETVLKEFENTLWSLQPVPPTPGNETLFEGNFVASKLFGWVQGNITVFLEKSKDGKTKELNMKMTGWITEVLGMTPNVVGKLIWVEGNRFRVQLKGNQPCMWSEAGISRSFITFLEKDGEVTGIKMPEVEPFYSWLFEKLI